jgi:NAD(P)-dependent dehydrogenase (short-subunit alcohol dehydrogenase family)
MNEFFDLTDKKALITGGSGGIGRAVALGMARYGADVAVAARTLSKVEAVAQEIRALGRKGIAISADVTDEQSVAAMVDAVVKEFSRIDILVNSAGLAIRGLTVDFSIDNWKQIMDFNALGTFVCCRAVGKVMIQQKSGRIINMSSLRAIRGTPVGAAAYSSSKGAVDALTRTLACEWGQYNICINGLAPSLIMTDLTRSFMEEPAQKKRLTTPIPLGRVAVLDDVVGPTIFLASEASSFITGQIIPVDGGTSAGIM